LGSCLPMTETNPKWTKARKENSGSPY
jgi:hypothetical protein